MNTLTILSSTQAAKPPVGQSTNKHSAKPVEPAFPASQSEAARPVRPDQPPKGQNPKKKWKSEICLNSIFFVLNFLDLENEKTNMEFTHFSFVSFYFFKVLAF